MRGAGCTEVPGGTIKTFTRGTEFPVATLLSSNVSWEQDKKVLNEGGGHGQSVSVVIDGTQEETSYDLMLPVNNLNK